MDSKIQELMDMISNGETLKVEFKSDLKQLPDRELVATVMNLSNTEGGDVLLGVEDNGSITYRLASKSSQHDGNRCFNCQ